MDPMDKPVMINERWYDQYPNISALFDVSRQFPTVILENIGESLIINVKQYHSILENFSEAKNLGPEVVLGLYKSKMKQRWYDSVPQMHSASNLLMALPRPVMYYLDRKYENFVKEMQPVKKKRVLLRPADTAYTVNVTSGASVTIENIEIQKDGSSIVQQRPKLM